MNESMGKAPSREPVCPVTGLRPPDSGPGRAGREPAPLAPPLPLVTASGVERLPDPGSPLAVTLRWMKEVLAQKHTELGRSGPVCPFVPQALQHDTIWLSCVPMAHPDRETLVRLMAGFREVFLDLEPRTGEAALYKAIVAVFSEVRINQAPVLIDAVQRELKPCYVESGLMIGEFYASNQTPGLHNTEFRPLRSPLPMLAIRHMVESDLPFLNRDYDTPKLRTGYVRSYLRRLGSVISARSFDLAIEALIRAEIEQRTLAAGLEPL